MIVRIVALAAAAAVIVRIVALAVARFVIKCALNVLNVVSNDNAVFDTEMPNFVAVVLMNVIVVI